jgi:hypothetical protein
VTWNLSASGHTADKDTEANLIDILQEAFRDVDNICESCNVQMFTAHHGTVDLLAGEQP